MSTLTGMVPLTWYLIVAAALFCIGAFGALARRCALREHFSPALDKGGTAITATQVITINFRR